MTSKRNPFRMVSALGIGVIVGTVAWSAFNLIGIAVQIESVGKYFTAAPTADPRDNASPTASSSTRTEAASAATPSEIEDAAPRTVRDEGQQPDYIADFDLPSPSDRAPLPDSGRLVMDPRMFVFDDNDTELESAIEELMFHPDDDVRQAAIENLLPAIGR